MDPREDSSSNGALPGQINLQDDWSHVRETVNMLYLAVCQIGATLSDSNESVNTLAHSFSELATHTMDVSRQVQSLSQPQELEKFKVDIQDTANEMTSNISRSIEAFQFYDRVCQRLDHVTQSLEKVTSVMESQTKINDLDSWRSIQKEIKNSYTMEAEHTMFEYIMRGGKVKEALNLYKDEFTKNGDDDKNSDRDDIELF